MRNVRVFLVPRALVVLGTVRLPVPQAHPAKVVLTVEALHVVAAAVLLDADVTLWTVLGVGADVVGRFAVVGALCQPLADDLAIGGRVVVHSAPEAERRRAHLARRLLRADVRAADDDLLDTWEKRDTMLILLLINFNFLKFCSTFTRYDLNIILSKISKTKISNLDCPQFFIF